MKTEQLTPIDDDWRFEHWDDIEDGEAFTLLSNADFIAEENELTRPEAIAISHLSTMTVLSEQLFLILQRLDQRLARLEACLSADPSINREPNR